MRIALITLTETGIATANRIIDGFDGEADLFLPQKYSEYEVLAKFYSESLSELTKKLFGKYNGLVFIMAMGIVVRVISPNIRDKYTDPAVVVIDDVGRHVISALSGHEGGANDLACRVAGLLRTEAIVTTGTEAHKDIVIGVGCKRDAGAGAIKEAIEASLTMVGQDIGSVRLIATIDLKADEKGLIEVSNELGVPMRIIAREEIKNCVFDYEKSDFVEEKIGIGAVCEPAALLGGRKTRLILAKQKFAGVTVAIAKENLMW